MPESNNAQNSPPPNLNASEQAALQAVRHLTPEQKRILAEKLYAMLRADLQRERARQRRF